MLAANSQDLGVRRDMLSPPLRTLRTSHAARATPRAAWAVFSFAMSAQRTGSAARPNAHLRPSSACYRRLARAAPAKYQPFHRP